MSTTETTYEHIVLDEHGVPIIEGTTMKVIEPVLDTLTYGWSPEDVLDADIARRLAYVDELRRTTPPSTLHARLRQQGLV